MNDDDNNYNNLFKTETTLVIISARVNTVGLPNIIHLAGPVNIYEKIK